VRDHAGGRPPFALVPAARQRQALALLESEVLSPDAFKFSPALLNRLTVDPLVWRSADPAYRLYNNAVGLQNALLAHLLGPAVAERLVEMEARAPAGQSFPLGELYNRLLASVWSELRSGAPILPLRRALQREHLDLLERMALRPPPRVPEDVRSLARANLRTLVTWLRSARPARLSPEARAHIDDSLAQANRALAASLQLAPG
jgi:Met-zincin